MSFHYTIGLSLLLIISSTIVVAKSVDYTNFVYKGCAKQGLSDPTGSQALASLFGALVSQSTKAKFHKTSTSSGGQSTITGLFQCRGDLANADCFNCVSKIPELMDRLCGKVVAARVQLHGCYMMYEVAGFIQISGLEMLYKTCSATHVDGVGFAEKGDVAFQALSNGVVANHGFFNTRYEDVFVLGQCEGDVGDADCGECVKTAIQKAKDECGSSIWGQVYLHKCFISYNYFPNGIPTKLPSGSGRNIGKTTAIILGGAAVVGFLVVCLVFTRNLLKKKDDALTSVQPLQPPATAKRAKEASDASTSKPLQPQPTRTRNTNRPNRRRPKGTPSDHKATKSAPDTTATSSQDASTEPKVHAPSDRSNRSETVAVLQTRQCDEQPLPQPSDLNINNQHPDQSTNTPKTRQSWTRNNSITDRTSTPRTPQNTSTSKWSWG